ncbi:translocation and assembly module lipoprotein TamL [Solitalea koreensis]|uniref:translocation and assembly module lipoprotein TamL n=1 Tax=Solitalea koreensis TaxID=543615 RepID=UPI001156FF03|nr:BamA/TamA family outer membrane protein [Solitalea koreensis]
MKSSILRHFYTTIITILIFTAFSGCNPTRYLNKNQSIISKVKIEGVDKDLTEDVTSFLPKANSKLLGLNIPLGMYNTFNVKNGHYKEKPKKIGQAPQIFDSLKANLSALKVSKFLFNKGFFNNIVTFTVDSVKKQTIAIKYVVNQGLPYTVKDYSISIADSNIYRLYLKNYKQPLDSGERYDIDKLEKEQQAIYTLMRNNGYREFQKNYVKFTADTNQQTHQLDLKLTIKNPPDKDKHLLYSINDVFISISPDNRSRIKSNDTSKIKDHVFFIDKENKYKAKRFSNILFLNYGNYYRNNDYLLTYNRLGDLGLFKFINFTFTKNQSDSSKLDVGIDLIPSKQRSLSLEGEATLSGSNIGFNAGTTYTSKNIFGGGEALELKLKGGFETQPKQTPSGIEQPHIRSRNLQSSASIIFPRILSPFQFNVGRYGLPRTRLTLGYSDINQIDRAVTNINTLLSYDWRETVAKSHILTPVNVGLVNGRIDSAAAIGLSLAALSRYQNSFTLGSQYTYTYNDYKLRFGGTFNYLRISFDLAGNTLYILSKLSNSKKDSSGQYNIFGRPYNQYLRPEIEIRRYQQVSNKQLVFRFATGIGYAYANGKSMPYDKLYGVGGANSNRGWGSRFIGPGGFPINEVSAVQNITELQIGELKIEANTEYRFNISNNFFTYKLNGATFIDASNVWNIKDIGLLDAQFKFNKFYKEFAIATGAGLRLDMGFLIIRTDLGLKLHDPQFFKENRWVISKWGNSDFKEKYPNYKFLNFNFGIGYPF